jgi:hypothetical protein
MLALTVCVAQGVVSVIHGTVKKIDKSIKTVVVKTADGTEHTVKVTDSAVVHGSDEGFDGLKDRPNWWSVAPQKERRKRPMTLERLAKTV